MENDLVVQFVQAAALLNAIEPVEFAFLVLRKGKSVCLLQGGDTTKAGLAAPFAFERAGLAVVADPDSRNASVYCFREPYDVRRTPEPPPPAHKNRFEVGLRNRTADQIATILADKIREIKRIDHTTGLALS